MSESTTLIQVTPFEAPFVVRSYETGPDGALTFPNLCNYLQETAGLHADQLGFSIDDMVREGNTWVLYRLKMKVDRFPGWGDRVRVQTWPSGVKRLFAFREFRIRDVSGNLMATGTSIWILINLRTRRPVRVEQVMSHYSFEGVEQGSFEEMPPVDETPGTETIFNVRKSDLDRNLHVNNTRYISWALESVPDSAGIPKCLDIIFKAEAFFQDRIQSTVTLEAAQTYKHRLCRASDQKELAVAVSTWNKRNGSPD